MEKEVKYLISLLDAYLKDEGVKLSDDVNYKRLYNRAKAHNLSATVFCVINKSENKEVVPNEAFSRFQNDFYDSVIRYEIQSGIIEELDTLLRSNDVFHVFFKGAEIKEYYPVPQSRVMGDVDLLIREADRDRVKSLLCENGWELINSNGPVYDYDNDGVRLEAHTKIISGKVGSSNAEECFADAADNAENGRLNAEYHFVYLIAHLAHHFWFYGAGIKMILDLAVFQKRFELDYDRVFEKLKSAGLEKFAKTVLSVCYRWFGVGKDFGENTEKTEEVLVSFGAFGNYNRNNSAVIERKELEEGKNLSPLKTKLRLVFPSYEKMKNIPYISFIEGKPYLTPAAWAYRLYYNLRYRKEFVADASKEIGSEKSKKEAEQELAYFKEIGL